MITETNGTVDNPAWTWDPDFDLFAGIERLKRERNAVVLAHYYQDPDIQDIADYVGDSLGLAQRAAETQADVIAFAGVHFMAETAKVLNPNKTVVLPDLNAGCSLDEGCPPDRFRAFLDQHPDHQVVVYVNCSAAVKAMSDVVVTSSNAAAIVNSLPNDRPIVFAPDKNLGRYVQRQTGRTDMVFWDSVCMVHEMFSWRKIHRLLQEHPGATLIAHPECDQPVLDQAQVVGSTKKLLTHVVEHPNQTYLVATEPGILHQMRRLQPNNTYLQAPSNLPCACNNCPHMKLNTLEKLYLSLLNLHPRLELEPALMDAARRPIERMLQMSRDLGL